MPQLGTQKERRRNLRTPIGKTVPILWEDEDGQERCTQGRLIDVSVSGAKILLPIMLPERAPVSFNCLRLGVGGRGTVRYCNPAKGGYQVGLELSNGRGWHDQNQDLQNLAAAVDRADRAAQQSDALNAISDVTPQR